MNKTDINQIIGVSESYQLPDILLAKMLDDPSEMFEKFMAYGESLDHDWFTEYFEEEHANKSKMAQDFTPSEVCDLLAYVVGNAGTIADVCAGTGGLTIGMWKHNTDTEYICYEYSSRAIPLLLFNLAIRNINALVCRCNLLTGEEFEYYRISRGERFGIVCQLDAFPEVTVEAVVSNPPYSMKYDPKTDIRFPQYDGMLPSNFADYVFVAFALSILKDNGRAGFILPHGVLFRGNKEGLFRRKLIEDGILRSVIGLADKLFINTDIPTCILELRKDCNFDGILFIDASGEYEKISKKNRLRLEHLKKIQTAFNKRTEQERFSHLASIQEIRENDFNLNISRYVDTYVPEPIPDLVETMQKLGELEVEANKTKTELLEMVSQLYGTTLQADQEHKRALKAYKRAVTSSADEYKQEVLKFVT